MNREAFGKRLKDTREAVKLTQDDVAREFGLKRQSVSAWERGKNLPTLEQFERLGLLYGSSSDFLLYGVRTIPDGRVAILAKALGSACKSES